MIGNSLNETSFSTFEEYLKGNKLDVFGLNLYANNIGANGAKYIANGVKNLKVKDLDIDLYFNNVTEIGTKDLSDAIGELETLQKLSLNLDFNYIKN